MDDSILVQDITGINTFTRDNEWNFKEEYYLVDTSFADGLSNKVVYLFKQDDLGPSTKSFISTFADSNGYYLYDYSNNNYYLVCSPRLDGIEQTFVGSMIIEEVGFPSDNNGCYWYASEETDDEAGTDPEEQSDDETGDLEYIDDLEIKELLQDMYKESIQYHKDMYEVQQNSFDVSIVALTLNFVLVFLCGILVGCAFAKTLWHKMNLG